MKDEDIEIIEINEENSKEIKTSQKKSGKKLLISLIVLDLFAIIGLFITYGPIDYFRDFLITTAMRTQSHKYLARIFYDDKTINRIMANNYVGDFNEDTNSSDIVVGNVIDTGFYESIYEEQILKRDPDNNDYKIIPVSGTNYMGWKYEGYLVAIYDPSRVELAIAKKSGSTGQRLRQITKDNSAIVGINASGFVDRNEQGMGGEPTGVVIKDGKVISNTTRQNRYISGFNNDNVLVLTKDTPQQAIQKGMRDAVQFGPFLIVNGKPAFVKGDGGWGIQPRTVLAQRKDGIVLFLVVDGRQTHSTGIDIPEMIKILSRYRAHNAVNMDGGASSALVVNNELYSKPCAYNETGERWIPNAWILK
jgi:exopolysaccharide biosynthesis protein